MTETQNDLDRGAMAALDLLDVERLATAVSGFVTEMTGEPFRTDADEVTRFLLPRLSLAASPAPDPGAALREAAQAVVDSVHGVQYGTSTPRLPVTAESPVHWQVSGAAIDALRAALAQPDGES